MYYTEFIAWMLVGIVGLLFIYTFSLYWEERKFRRLAESRLDELLEANTRLAIRMGELSSMKDGWEARIQQLEREHAVALRKLAAHDEYVVTDSSKGRYAPEWLAGLDPVTRSYIEKCPSVVMSCEMIDTAVRILSKSDVASWQTQDLAAWALAQEYWREENNVAK